MLIDIIMGAQITRAAASQWGGSITLSYLSGEGLMAIDEWWERLDEIQKDYLREFSEDPLPADLARAIADAGGTPIHVTWPDIGDSGAWVLSDDDVDWIARDDA
jgi:hypothetical protein